MSEISENDLAGMSSRELLELQARIHEAIRAHIRLKNAQLAASSGARPVETARLPQVEQSRQRSLAVFARTRDVAETARPPSPPPGHGEQPQVQEGAFDLERERDAWLARKRASAK